MDPSQQYSWTITRPDELTRIFDIGVQVVRWQRPENFAISAYLQQALASNLFSNGFRTVIAAGKALTTDFLPDFSGRKAIIDDILLISNIYSDLLGCNEIAVRLEILNGAMCPRFHVDRTGIRLVCTYLGNGTEWIDDRWVNRSKPGSSSAGFPDETSGLFDSRTVIEAAAQFDITLFKGLLWQGNAGRGAIHRSPTAMSANGSRILLVMDAIWD